MNGPKHRAMESIQNAQAQLETALAELETLTISDPHSVGFSAHALNNFLTLTNGTVALLIQALKDHPDPQVISWLENLLHGTKLMAHIVGCLMNIPSADKFSMKWEKFDPTLLVQRLCSYYRRIADRKEITIVVHPSGDLPPVWSDRAALGVVLDNLMSNAVKFSPPGERIRVELKAAPEHVICAVQDNGPGLSDQDLASLYKKGTRLSAVPTGGEASTGYGLAVARSFSEKLGADLRCESSPGAGTTFFLHLPVFREHLHDDGHSPRPSAATSNDE